MASVYSLNGKTKEAANIPKVFKTPVRWDLIRRAVVALESQERQLYGTDELAGRRTSADYFGRRRKGGSFRQTINREISRLPRIKTGGGGLGNVRRVPQSVGGRRAHPPKPVDKSKQINKGEYKKALASAIAASADRTLVAARGHKIDRVDTLPIVFDDSLEEVKKTKQLVAALEKAGLGEEIERAESKLKGKSLLIVAGEDKGLLSAARAIAGVDAVLVSDMDARDLAPGARAGRLAVWTKSALKKLEDGSA